MTNLQMWSLIVGAILPPFIAIVQQSGWQLWVRAVVTLVICIVVGAITTYLSGMFDPQDLITSILTILIAAIATYKGFWQPTGIAPGIEKALLNVKKGQDVEHAP